MECRSSLYAEVENNIHNQLIDDLLHSASWKNYATPMQGG